MDEIEAQIQNQLTAIENRYDVKIIHAIESGSRAWGFPSQDSDYDIRFIYCHRPEWYLSIQNKRDVIELPVDDLLDINGWDIKKALSLLMKSNPTLMEWLTSPIIYKQDKKLLEPLRHLAEKAFLPLASCHHYLSMSKRSKKAYLLGEKVRIKKYLYYLRPVLCCRWIVEHGSQPPMLFEDLLTEYLPSGAVREEINRLLDLKNQTKESDEIEHVRILENYVEEQVIALEYQLPITKEKLDSELFDEAFRQILKLAYPQF